MKHRLVNKLSIFVLLLTITIVASVTVIHYWINEPFLAGLISLVILLPIAILFTRLSMRSINQVLMALNDGFSNFLDNDFSISLAKTREDELGQLVTSFNRVCDALRKERVNLYQRELLLDSVIQTTPLSLVLVDDSGAIIYSNSSARQLFNKGKAINGYRFKRLLEHQHSSFLQSIQSGLNGLFTVSLDDAMEVFHLTQNTFLLNGRTHHLYLFKLLTKEISRQEVSTWKKVIRLISHELNNSLAPISSLAHSGQLICEKESHDKLKHIFLTIEERAKYLQHFIEEYAKFARLPRPRAKKIEARPFFENLQNIRSFTFICQSNTASIYGDPAQLQQVIINLIKNAHESGSELEDIVLELIVGHENYEIKVKDRGKGMSDKSMSNALLPFFSTKSDGTGLGLPLCKEIIESHGGKLFINNRTNGGLVISLLMPILQENDN